MKNLKWILAGLLVLSWVFKSSAATPDAFASINVSLESPAKMQAMLKALTLVPPVPFDSLPRNKRNQVVSSGYWSMQNPTLPPFPCNALKLDLWPLGDGAFVLDDRLVNYSELQAEAEWEAKLAAAPLNSGGDGFKLPNTYSMMCYPSNVLCLEILSVDLTGQVADLLAHNTHDNLFIQLLSKTNLLQPAWTLVDYQPGTPGTNQTEFYSVSLGDNPTKFFWAHEAEWSISVSAGQNEAIEPQGNLPGQNQNFTVTRQSVNNAATNDLTVYYRITGTASNVVDYTELSGMMTFSNNSSSADITVQPVADLLVEGRETVTVTLIPTNTYLIASVQFSSGTIDILDSSTTVRIEVSSDTVVFEQDGPPGVSATLGQFTVSRSDVQNIYTNLAVTYLISGTASNGVDYVFLTNTINFVPGPSALATNIDIIPRADIFPEGIETVTLTLVATNTYLVEAGQSNATVSIDDTSTRVFVYAGGSVIEPGQSTSNPGETGSFLFTRSDTRGIFTNLAVRYAVSGTASNGVDYTNLSGTVNFVPGMDSTNILISPLADYQIEGTETVILTLIPDPTNQDGYVIDSDASAATNTIADSVLFDTVVTNLNNPIGIDYHAPSNGLVVSYNYSGGTPYDFAFIYTNLVLSNSVVMTNTIVTNWSGVHGVGEEVKLATVKADANGFTNGDMYFSSDTGIGFLSADGTRSNLNWCILTNSTVTNGLQIRGSLYVDQTGVWSNDLIVVTSPSGASLSNKGVWRVNTNHQPTLVANINTRHLEGVITLPNDTNHYWGPWAGKIITGDENALPIPLIYTIATNGTITTNITTSLIPGGIATEDFDIIPANQDLYCVDYRNTNPAASAIARLSKNYFTNYVGDLLITEAGENAPPGNLFVVHWDASTTNFIVHKVPFKRSDGSTGRFEHVTFAPIDLPNK